MEDITSYKSCDKDVCKKSCGQKCGATGEKMRTKPMYIKTPLIESRQLTELTGGIPVYLKLENTQPCGSFKLRGISNMIQKKIASGCKSVVASSGGNAGMAAAYVARHLKIPLTLYVPHSTDPRVREKLKAEGANVIAHGTVWNEADARALQDATDPQVGYIPPFDHPDVWEGHESLVEEVADQLKEMGVEGGRPGLVIVSVGGGGLLVGVVQAMDRLGWKSVPVLAMETVGADCFNAAVEAGHLVTLPAITSIAKCLGALTVCERAFQLYNERPIVSRLVTDKQCVEATSQFLDDHRFLVEPACGASIAAIYSGLIQRLQDENKLPSTSQLRAGIVLVVCGGISVSAEMLAKWKHDLLQSEGH